MSVRSQKTFADARSLTKASEALACKCRIMRDLHRRNGTPPLRDYTQGFGGLAKIVTGQQLSAASAAAIWSRVQSSLQPVTAEAVLAAPPAELAALGLSAGKIRTLKAVATAIQDGALSLDRLHQASNEDLHAALTAIHGIGPWTADIYLLFALRRADAFPAGDLALQIAVQRHFRLENRPSAAELLDIAERWRPWRGAAAHLLWADYGAARMALRRKQQRNAKSSPQVSVKKR